MKADIVIIGGGVTGTAVARKLTEYELDIILVEKEADLASGTSKANSGIVHAGYNADPETMKGQLNIQANPLFDKLCSDLNVPFQRTGSLVVGFNQQDLETIKQKKENGDKIGIPGLEIIGRRRLQKIEPHINDRARWALYAPSAGIVSPHELTIALGENAAQNGLQVMLENKVEDIETEKGALKAVVTNRERIECDVVINAAGVYADSIARMAGDEMVIRPRKGEYFIFDREYGDLINHVLFPTPTETSKGILVTATAHGNLLVGPNAYPAGKEDLATTSGGLVEIMKGAVKLIPDLPRGGVISSFAGLRAAAPSEDFIISPSPSVWGLIHAAGIQSPGLTAAPATAERVEQLVKGYYPSERLVKKDDFQETLPEKPHLYDYDEGDLEDWNEYIDRREDYGEVVCRCEHVTRGEIIDALHSPVPAQTLDAIKRRARAGMGRCQGGFCGPRVVEIIAEELGISPREVTKKGPGSEILQEKTKDLRLKKKTADKENRDNQRQEGKYKDPAQDAAKNAEQDAEQATEQAAEQDTEPKTEKQLQQVKIESGGADGE